MTETAADGSTETVRRLLPEIDRIDRPELRAAVAGIWAKAWCSSVWRELTDVPKSPELPAKRTLVTHTRAVTQIAASIVDVESAAHGMAIDKDTTLAIALLHDVCKLHEFEPAAGDSSGQHSRTGKLYQHGFLGGHWALEAGLDEAVVHGVIAHTPQSATVPQTQEAVIVHYADFVDSDVLLLDAGRTLFCKRRG